MSMDKKFSASEQKILAIVQSNLPDSLYPYASIADEVNCTEQEVLTLLQSLKAEGAIRRFGASIKHQKAGFNHNAMVAWEVNNPQEADEAAEKIIKHPLISHCYYRPSTAKDWTFNLFTMLHGRHKNECLDIIEYIKKTSLLKNYIILTSLKELKKTSMSYF